jgi:hypothetical protein
MCLPYYLDSVGLMFDWLVFSRVENEKAAYCSSESSAAAVSLKLIFAVRARPRETLWNLTQ